MGDFDWRSLVKPVRAATGVDIGPFPIIAAAGSATPRIGTGGGVPFAVSDLVVTPPPSLEGRAISP